MGKIGIIIWREYMSIIKNRTFIIMCFVLPLMVVGLFVITQKIQQTADQPRTIVVVDATACPDSISYAYAFQDTVNLRFNYDHIYQPWEQVKKLYKDSSHVSILWIPDNFMGGCDSAQSHSSGLGVKLMSTTPPGNNTLNLLEAMLSKEVQRDMMRINHISQRSIDLALKRVTIADEVNGTISNGETKAVVGLLFGIIIYMYILLFGVRVMRSVVEEKTTRIVEIIISSVKPLQLMFGKIIGVTFAGITQLLVWLVLSVLIVVPVINSVNDQKLDVSKLQVHEMKTGIAIKENDRMIEMAPTEKTQQVIETAMSIPWGNLIPAFIFYFLFGYLLYASIFAAIGSAADVEADTQQFTFPVTIPLIIAMVSSGVVIADPDGAVAKWLSMIPFTSPIVMLIRIPFGGVSVLELLTSFAILISSFLLVTWIAAKIYRVGILMYGKKASWKELGKWIFYKA